MQFVSKWKRHSEDEKKREQDFYGIQMRILEMAIKGKGVKECGVCVSRKARLKYLFGFGC